VTRRSPASLPLHVLITGDNFGFPDGLGATARVRAVGAGLVRAGASVEVMPTAPSVLPGDPSGASQAAGSIDGISYRQGAGTRRPSDSRVVRRLGRLRGPGAACVAAAGMSGPPPDAIIFFVNDSFVLPLIAGSAGRLRRAVLLVDGCELPFVYRGTDLVTQISRLSYAKGFLNWYDGILAISRYLEAYYRARVGARTAIMHLPILVDCDRFAQPSRREDAGEPPYIGYSGSLAPSKGVETLLRAFGAVASRYPDVTLRITGLAVPRTYRQELDRLVSDLDLGDRVRFLGLIPAGEIPSFLQRATALVIPHPAAVFSEAAFPTKLGEYLATGVPVVATRVGEIESYLTSGRTAFLADPDRWESLAEALDAILNDPEGARSVGREGAVLARREFDIGRHGRRLYEFIEDLRERKDWTRGKAGGRPA
jgi:glycosyltransferase involved in cell wall biosynthesis